MRTNKLIKKKLMIADPIIDVYPGYATTLSIALQHNNGKLWFIENYLNLYAHYDIQNDFFFVDYLTFNKIYIASGRHCQIDNILSPVINTYSFPVDIITSKYNIIKFIKDMINKNRYIHLYINRKYINAFQINYNHTHETFIYGYDDKDKIIFFNDYTSKYNKLTCSYDELISAFDNAGEGDIADVGMFQQITRAKINILEFNQFLSYDFTKQVLLRNIDIYLNSNALKDIKPCIFDVTDDAKYDEYYGISHYDAVLRYTISCSQSNRFLDRRLFHFLYTHKMCIKYKIEYLAKIDACPESLLHLAEEMVQESFLIRNIALKMNHKKSDVDFKNGEILDHIKKMKQKEIALLSSLHAELIKSALL